MTKLAGAFILSISEIPSIVVDFLLEGLIEAGRCYTVDDGLDTPHNCVHGNSGNVYYISDFQR